MEGPGGARIIRNTNGAISIKGAEDRTGRRSRRGVLIMNVDSILREKGDTVVTVNRDQTVTEVARVLAEHKIGAVVVCDGGRVVGVLSERDIVRGIDRLGADVLKLPVSEIMSSPVHCCQRDDSVIEIMEVMTERRIRHVPVVEDGQLLGIISIGDVVKHRIMEAERENEAMRQYITTA